MGEPTIRQVSNALVCHAQRMATSKYTTARMSTLEDFQCQICLSTLRDCVAIEPCGHNFCAACLSHHFASQLLVGFYGDA